MSANAIRFSRRRANRTPRRQARNLLPIEPCKACQSAAAVKGSSTRYVECSNRHCAATGPQAAGDQEAVGLWNFIMAPCRCARRTGETTP